MSINIEKLRIPKNSEDDLPQYPVIKTRIQNYNFYSHLIDDLSILNQKMNVIDIDVVRTHFSNLGRLSKKQALKILSDARNLFKQEPNNLDIKSSSYILGDIHGQYFDLINVISSFDLNNDILVFLGDYVDRGIYSTETFLYLCLLKIYYKDNVYLLRGNHESRSMTTKYTFKTECINKYDESVYEEFLKTFNTLPLTAVIMDSVFCVHGGISPNIKNLSDINSLNRFTDIIKNTPMSEILWSDPHLEYDTSEELFITNSLRKCSFYYTYKSVSEFLKLNNLKCIIRGHEVKEEGYHLYKNYEEFPSLITLFSAPNYCDEYKNKGSFLYFDGTSMNIRTYEEVTHPKLLLNNLDGVNWTFPFISEKISEFYISLLQVLNNTSEEIDEILLEKEIRKSINLQLSMIIVRTERENILQEVDECTDLDMKKNKGISMNIPESLVPNITEELSKLSLNKVLKKSLVHVDENSDKGEILTPPEVSNKEGGCTGWIF
ncbi:hypothetical protein P3W45_000431 [Vairimorpha bombi]